MNKMARIVLLLFLSYSCVPSGSTSTSEGDGTTNPATSSGGSSSDTDTSSGGSSSDTDTDTSTDNELLNLAAPANPIDGSSQYVTDRSPEIEWDSVTGAASYEVAIGSTSGGTEVLGWTDVGNINIYQATGLSLTPGIYYASIRAVGPSNEKGPAATADGFTVTACPAGYIPVPGNTTTGLGGSVYTQGTKSNYDWVGASETIRSTADFCVMKYEAKLEIDGVVQPDGDNPTNEITLTIAAAEVTLNGITVETTASFGGGAGLLVRPVSVATGKPWVRPERSAVDDVVGADGLCESLGAGYQLIGNQHWQAIARDIESVASNFDTLGPLINHAFNRGHSDGTAALPASSIDTEGCANYIATDLHDNTLVSATCDDGWHLNKRTHSLSNGEVIWDLSGNVYEWVRDNSSVTQGGSGYVRTTPFSDALKWGPANDYSGQTGAAEAGLGYFFDASAGAVIRGGYWDGGTNAGPFDALLGYGPSVSSTHIGFRCVFAP